MNAIESAAFAAWPALEEEDFHGWQLRFSQGYTKRANSANSTPAASDLTDSQIGQIEQRYRARGLPAIFRLTTLSAPPAMERLLAGRGYRFTDASQVMVVPLAGAGPDGPALEIGPDAAAWLQDFQRVSGHLGPEQAIHLRMLRAIKGPCAFALQRAADGEPVSCGLGVQIGDWLGLFDIATRADCRGQGLARQLCAGLLAWGQRAGAPSAFLQVLASNTGAIRLYERLGFRLAYRYGYWVQP